MNLLAISRTRNEHHLTLSHHQVSLLILLQLLALCPQPNCYVSAIEATPSDHLPSIDQKLKEALLSNDGHPARTADDQVVIAAWKELMAKGKQWSDHMANDRWLPYLEQKFTATGVNISAPCQNDIRRTLTSFGRLETWAAQMIDSWGKFPPSGILEGSWTDLGSYDLCLATQIPSVDNLVTHPQYCTIEFRPLLPSRPRYHNIIHPLSVILNVTNSAGAPEVFQEVAKRVHFAYYVPLRLGVCLPSTCSPHDIDTLVKQVGLDVTLHARLARKCDLPPSAQKKPLTPGQWFAIFFLAATGLSCLIGTVIDMRQRYRASSLGMPRWMEMMMSFSIPRNASNLMNTKSGATDLGCIHGLRVLMITWIIMGHTFLWINYTIFGRSFNVINIVTPFFVQPLFHVNIAVDAFFFMSGLLTTYATWSLMQKTKGEFNWFIFVIARYWRLTPTFGAVIILTLLLPLVSSGPLWGETIDTFVENCQENWWINLLYLHNFISVDKICLLHTWYLANDMQFHVASLIVVLAFLKSPMWGMITNALSIAFFTIVSFLLTYINEYPPHSVTTQPEVEERWDYVTDYKFKPWVHGGAFCVGLALGYHLAKRHSPDLSKIQKVLGWMLTTALFAIITFGIYGWNNGGQYSPWLAALYSSTHRTLWSIGLSWVVFMCSTGQGGWINSFLSWKGFIPFGRITYSVYLVHGWFILIYMGSLRQRIDVSYYQGSYMFISHWFISMVFGFIFCTLFESPFLSLQKDILTRHAAKSARPVSDSDDSNAIQQAKKTKLNGDGDFESDDSGHDSGSGHNNSPSATSKSQTPSSCSMLNCVTYLAPSSLTEAHPQLLMNQDHNHTHNQLYPNQNLVPMNQVPANNGSTGALSHHQEIQIAL